MINRHTMFRTLPIAAAMVALSSPAFAHLTADQHAHNGFATGFGHPVSGLDHLAAMVAVGLWAAQRGGRLIWALPATFVGVMLLGGALGMAGIGMPLVEPAISASVLILGLLIATAVRLPAPASVVLVGLFALFHGHAHGTELPAGVTGAVYTVGFALATALLHGVGIGAALGLSRVMKSEARRDMALRLGGGAIAAAGALMVAGVF